MWYEKKFRRHLCDMHIDDWNEEFLSKFSPEEYLENLKRAKIQNAMLYFQSHVGLCYYPTRSGKMHRALEGCEDKMQRLAKMCRENGIAVTGYYSLIYNNWAYQEHPTWRIIPPEGEKGFGECVVPPQNAEFTFKRVNRYGFCCPNNPEYRRFVSDQIQEICEYFEFDGMFFDMLFWPQLCRCEHCRRRFKEETGYDLPEQEDWNDQVWLLHIEKRRSWMGEFAQSVTDEIKQYRPQISVEHNVANAVTPSNKVCLAEEVLNACDYAGGDLYGGIYHQSFACKFYKNVTVNQPFEYMLSRCEPYLSKHTITKSEDALLSSIFLTSAHHGASLVIDAIDPVGTLDERFYQRLGNVFAKTMPYEKYFTGTMVEDIGIYYSMHSKFNAHGEPYHNHMGSVNLAKLLLKEHICCGVTGRYHDLEKYPVLLASCLTGEDACDDQRLISYVKNGGMLYLSGGDCKGLLREFFGAEVTGRTGEHVVYIAPKMGRKEEAAFGWFTEKYPLQFEGSAPIVQGIKDSSIVSTLTLPYTAQDMVRFASIHSNPPGIQTQLPTVAVTEYGKGKVLWSALPIEAIESPYQYGEVFKNLIQTAFDVEKLRTMSSDAPSDVELTVFTTDHEMTIAAVQLCEDACARKTEPFSVNIKTDRKPKYLLKLPQETACDFIYQDGTVTYELSDWKLFDMKKLVFS